MMINHDMHGLGLCQVKIGDVNMLTFQPSPEFLAAKSVWKMHLTWFVLKAFP